MKKYLLALVLLFFTLPIFAKNTILVVGDSLSANYGFAREKGWVILLENHLKAQGYDYDVVNASISGDTTSNGLARLPAALNTHQPKITIIELGGNDGLRGLALSLIKRNLQSMITLAKSHGSKVLLAGIRLPSNLGPDYTQQFSHLYVELAEQNSVGLVPIFLHDIDNNPTLMQSDRIHPTDAAQEKIMQNVWHVLKDMLEP